MSDSKGGQNTGVDEQRALDEVATPQSEQDDMQRQAVQEYSEAAHKGQLSMLVKVYSPFRDYFDGPAFSLTAENETGPFDILPRHHNFISLLSPCEMIIRSANDGDQRIKIGGGLMHVKADKVIVFLDV